MSDTMLNMVEVNGKKYLTAFEIRDRMKSFTGKVPAINTIYTRFRTQHAHAKWGVDIINGNWYVSEEAFEKIWKNSFTTKGRKVNEKYIENFKNETDK